MLFLLGILDLLSVVVLLLLEFSSGSWVLGAYASSYLIFKTIMFYESLVSWFDGAVGLWIFLLMLGLSSPFITYLGCVWLSLKAIMSLFS